MKKWLKIVLSILIVLLVAGLLVFLISRKEVKSFNDLDKYDEYLSNLRDNSDAHSKLLIFPNKIEKEKVEEFEYLSVEGLFDGSYLFYIIVNYDDNSLKKEIERIKQIKRTYNGKDKFIISEENLKYPTYVTICDGMDTYEYAMIDGNKIVYVFRQIFTANNKLDKKYELEYIVPRDKRDKYTPGYNMYYFYDKYGIGYMEGYEEIQVKSK